MKRALLKLVFVCSLIVFFISGALLCMYGYRYYTDESSYKTLRDDSRLSASLTDGSSKLAVDFDALSRANADTVGWLYGNDGKIDYPIVQGEDNAYYLRHLFSKKVGSAGALFLDARNAADFSDINSVIYGHNMRVGTMFGTLDNYCKQSYYEAHPTLTLATPQGEKELTVLAGVEAPARSIVEHLASNSSSEARDFVSWARKHSSFSSNAQFEKGDHLVTLITCAYDYADARYILICSTR